MSKQGVAEQDISMRIAKALRCKHDPLRSVPRVESAIAKQVIGTLPFHLRHLHNLLQDVILEAQECEDELEQADEESRLAEGDYVGARTRQGVSVDELELFRLELARARMFRDEQRRRSEFASGNVDVVIRLLKASIVHHVPATEFCNFEIRCNWSIVGDVVEYESLTQTESLLTRLAPLP